MTSIMPKKSAHLRVTDVGEEALIYSTASHEAHSLNKLAAFILNHCDGQTPIDEVARLCETELDCQSGEEVVRYTLERFRQKNLVEDCEPGAVTRKELLSTVGKVALALPVITSVLAPIPAMAQSCITGATCRSDGGENPSGCSPCFNAGDPEGCVSAKFCMEARCTSGTNCANDGSPTVTGGTATPFICQQSPSFGGAVQTGCTGARAQGIAAAQQTAVVGGRMFDCTGFGSGAFLYACCECV